MAESTQLTQIIFSAIDELNRQLPKDQQLTKCTDTPLVGAEGTLDSVALVNLIVITEQKIEEHFNVSLSLAEDGLASADGGPFQSIGSLIQCVATMLEGKSRA